MKNKTIFIKFVLTFLGFDEYKNKIAKGGVL